MSTSLLQRIRSSVFTAPVTSRTGRATKRFLLSNLILHFRPVTVPERTLKFSLTWGLGGMAAVLVLLQLFTGILLKFVYAPIPVQAYASILTLQNSVLFGRLIRNVHHWSANILVLVVFLHVLRVFFTGAFHAPRQFNWIIGLGLFSLILGANFTGYLLPWDQLAYWAVTICTGMLDYLPGIGSWLRGLIKIGPEIGSHSLKIFYAIHTAVLPGLLLPLMAFHFWRVRRAGGLVIPRISEDEPVTGVQRIPTVPNLLIREVVVGLVLVSSILMLAFFFNAPLGEPANPGLSPNPTKAPWYFAGIQELLSHFHPVFVVGVMPVMIIGALLLLPYLNYEKNTSGIWFVSGKGRRTTWIAASVSVTITPLLVILDEYVLNFSAWIPGASPVISNGLIPFFLCLIAVSGFYLLIRKMLSTSNNEAVQAVFVLLCVSFVVLTIIDVWFRGSGMILMWPWDM